MSDIKPADKPRLPAEHEHQQNKKLIEALRCIEPIIRQSIKVNDRWNVSGTKREDTPVYSVNGCELTLSHCDKILSALNSIKEQHND